MIELVECTRYAARITAKACESFRATDKARCGGCPGHQGVVATVEREERMSGNKAPFSFGWQDQLFVGEDQLLARLNREAAKERRDLKQQLLYIVESYFEATFDVRED